MIECEIKLKIEDLDTVKEKLLSMGFMEYATFTETDTYFDTADGKIRESDTALRIRETVYPDKDMEICQINFKEKKLDEKTMSRYEHETGISDSKIMTKVLSCLGYFPVLPKVIKTRTLLRSPSVSACLDSVNGLGDYLELESIVETENEKISALENINRILSTIGYSIEDTTTISYLSALQSKTEFEN